LLVTYPQSPELMQPGEGALDYPTRQPQMVAMFRCAFADLGTGATLPRNVAIALAVVGAIGLHMLWLRQGTARSFGDRGHALQQWHLLRRIVRVGSSQDDIERETVAIDEEVV